MQAWVRSYPIDRFPTLWERLEQSASDGLIHASIEVLNELSRKQDDLYDWAKNSSIKFIEIDDDIQENVIELLATHPRLLNVKSGKSGADPFVIATAMKTGASVVTDEDTGSEKNPKIPFVCNAYNVSVTNALGLIRNLDFVF